jgi:hypothetical protein
MVYVNWILVPTDFSKDSNYALRAADSQAEFLDCGLILLHVTKLENNCRRTSTSDKSPLDRWAELIRYTPPSRVALMTCQGEPVQEILRVAEQYKPRKIVMGRGGTIHNVGKVAAGVSRGFRGYVQMVSESHCNISVHTAA